MASFDATQIEDCFRYFDRNNNGYIEASELEGALIALGASPSKAQVEELLKSADKSLDGRLSYQEFSTIFASFTGQ